MAGRIGWLGCWLAVGFGLVSTTGCLSTTSNAFKPLASVVVQAADVDEVGIATMAVFVKEGFVAREVKRGSLNFERRGSTWDTVMYGGLQSGDVWERVKVRVSPVTSTTFRVEGAVYKVKSPGDQVFEEERRVRPKSMLDKLLKQIQAQLEHSSPAK